MTFKGNGIEVRFVADSMLGKLARWLRVMGYDTHYQAYYRPDDINGLMKEGRCFLTRHRKRAGHYDNALLLHSNNVGEQLAELKEKLPIAVSHRASWFTRCLICNTVLKETHIEEVRENVPEYVFYQNMTAVKACHLCGRHYWPGSHRSRMISKLEEWGFGS